MNNLAGLKIAICQMNVVPGKPDINTANIIGEIKKAAERGVDIIAFPEMSTTGYLIGDKLEDISFVMDVARWNNVVIEATACGITAVFGTVVLSPGKKGENGRQRIHNAAIIAHNGKMLYRTYKSLQPNYRFFNDDKQLYPMRKVAEEAQEMTRRQERVGTVRTRLKDFLTPIDIPTSIGVVKVGTIICEDMWHEDYPHNPTKILADKGAEIIFNLSASPWTWQKNRRRHKVVKNLLQECRVPFVYVNNTGAQNTGKNIIVFDGSSAVYSPAGNLILEVEPYKAGTQDFTLPKRFRTLRAKPQAEGPVRNDTKELYAAMVCATKSMVPANAQIFVGLSGGVDSAVVAAHMVDVLGPERVVAVNMPMTSLSSKETRDIARTIAANLGIAYEVHAIDEMVGVMCRHTGITPGTLEHENVQARARMTLLAAFASQHSGVFTCNMNKTEAAFGYGTLHGDIAGFYAPLGDMVKREVRQIGRYLNEMRFKREVIPEICIRQIPTAELSPGQKDPFDYGDEHHRGYHDEMVRAFTEFRKDPEWFVELYMQGKLERELLLEEGVLARLFATPREFIANLEWCWKMFDGGSFFKRVQCPPTPVFSKRAFGRDLEESMMRTHFTERYKDLKAHLLAEDARTRQQIAIFGTSANPPGEHHRAIVKRLAEMFDTVIVVPCGLRGDKQSVSAVSPLHRREMARLAFSDMSEIELDLYDVENLVFTPTYLLYERYRKRFPDAELWMAVGSDIIEGGSQKKSEIHRVWEKGREVWERLNFAVIEGDKELATADLPPFCQIVPVKVSGMRSTIIRGRIATGESIDVLVTPEVAEYIEKNNLYA